MTDITIYVEIDPSRNLGDPALFSDLTPSTWTVNNPGDHATFSFADTLTDLQVRQITWRLTLSPNEEQVMDGLQNALGSLRQIRDSTGTLTELQLSDSVRALAKSMIWLLKLRVRDLTSPS